MRFQAPGLSTCLPQVLEATTVFRRFHTSLFALLAVSRRTGSSPPLRALHKAHPVPATGAVIKEDGALWGPWPGAGFRRRPLASRLCAVMDEGPLADDSAMVSLLNEEAAFPMRRAPMILNYAPSGRPRDACGDVTTMSDRTDCLQSLPCSFGLL